MCHVLIIEDEVLVAFHLQSVLSDHGAVSFDVAGTQDEAVAAARHRRPDFITSDVKLRSGRGPQAVQAIIAELGPMPVMFITGTPEDCEPCDPPHRVLEKPLHEPTIGRVFRELAPL